MTSNRKPFSVNDGFNLITLSIKEAEKDGTLKYISSTYEPQSQMIYDGYYETGRKIISFVNILQQEVIPFSSILHKLLTISQQEMGRPVELNSVLNFSDDYQAGNFFYCRFVLL